MFFHRTLKNCGEVRFDISRSVFIGYAARVESEEAAAAIVSQVKKLHRDATHHCSAYIVGKRFEIQKADDDGEPSGAAGRPILEVLKKQGLTDAVIVVTRYFGGIKLGAGGLIRAYGRGASEAVQAAGIIGRQLHMRVSVSCDYSLLAILENNLRNKGYCVTGKDFAEKATLYVLRLPTDAGFDQHIADWSAGTAIIRDAGKSYVDSEVMPEV